MNAFQFFFFVASGTYNPHLYSSRQYMTKPEGNLG